ncbi:hypothetical protein GCM10010274_35140 [Streptomyces lavendofoliae]|uniref:Uncharacterized protein n=1 Tax=Streptomyces lavendofoliae TaxID=67314 RepID=A0A918HZV8_9ACTN|nr:hypothetical protein GCM10010274_35140 [Streptomyces lavendofoliae]
MANTKMPARSSACCTEGVKNSWSTAQLCRFPPGAPPRRTVAPARRPGGRSRGAARVPGEGTPRAPRTGAAQWGVFGAQGD